MWDIVALNGSIELPAYYVPWLNKSEHAANAPLIRPDGHCSAFIATGSYTKGGKIVIAHNNWSSYADGERWTVMFDIQPEHGHRMVMDGEPGVITSQDDFGVNDAGLIITETTITQFDGWNPDGIPEFVRSRKAMQYASSIDEYVAIIKEGNNGGYANDWLVGDRKTGEIAYLELGLKNTPLWRTKDGYFISSNFPRDPALIKEETDGFDPSNMSSSMNARHVTWEAQNCRQQGPDRRQSRGAVPRQSRRQLHRQSDSGCSHALRPHRCRFPRRPGVGTTRPTIPMAQSPEKSPTPTSPRISPSSRAPDIPAVKTSSRLRSSPRIRSSTT